MRSACAIAIVLALAALGLNTRSESAREYAAVHAAVDGYLNGVATASAATLEQVWNLDHGRMVFVHERDGVAAVAEVPIRDAIARWTSRKPESSSGKVTAIDVIDGRMAVALVDMTHGPHHYIDVLSLYKVDGEWKIVNKCFVELAPEK